MNIRELANRLRKAANVLDALLDVNLVGSKTEREKTARKKILKKRKHVAWQHRPENAKKAEAWRKKMSKVNRGKSQAD